MSGDSEPVITVLSGGLSPERDVSLVTGRSIAEALAVHFRVELVELAEDALPDSLDAEKTVIFPALHGSYGEGGSLQLALEAKGFAYAGCGPEAARLCMNKSDTKRQLQAAGTFSLAREKVISAESEIDVASVIAELGEQIVIKPVDSGSSVGLYLPQSVSELKEILEQLSPGQWLLEECIVGREMTIGLLDGKALGIVEIVPQAGVYDYEHKYTAGATEYQAPARLPVGLTEQISKWAEDSFVRLGCRDFARLDFILSEASEPCFLEVNTIPGLTPTSLLPKSAHCLNYTFDELAQKLVQPAVQRFHSAKTICYGKEE